MAKSQRRGAPAPAASSPSASQGPQGEAAAHELLGNQATLDSLDSETALGADSETEPEWWSLLTPYNGLESEEDSVNLWEDLVDEVGPTVEELDTPAVQEDLEGPAFQDSEVDVEEVEEAIETVIHMEEAVLIDEEEGRILDLATRPEEVELGQRGALIGSLDEIEIRGMLGEDSSISHRVPNGTPVEILRIDSGWLEVTFRHQGKETIGWVSQALFSDQPSLYMDKANPGLQEDYTWTHVGESQISDDLHGTDVQQGGLADCYFIAAMNAVGTANPDFLKESIQFDESTGMYQVRFFEETGYDRSTGERTYDEVWIEVDGYLPTKGDSTSGAYASAAPGKSQWGAIMEKAYAKWKGGYDAIGDGGYGDQAMTELTGAAAGGVDTSRMNEEEVLNFFIEAEAEGLAVYAGSLPSFEHDVQTPLREAGEGRYTGRISQIHSWNNIDPGSLQIIDTGSNVASARDTGRRGDEQGEIVGRDVASGEVHYSNNTLSVEYRKGKAPESAEDLEVHSKFGGMIYPAKQVVGWHGYCFDKVVDGSLIQLYNPWGSWQPKPLTPAEFLKYYNGISTVQVPQAEGKK